MTTWTDTYGLLEQIKDRSRYGIFLDMGVGKTSLLLALIDHKFFTGTKKVLIITPKQVSLSTWQNEIKKWSNFNYMLDSVELIVGDEDKRNDILKRTKEFQIHIVSSSLTEWMVGKRVKMGRKTVMISNLYTPEYDLVIVDECSQFKDPTTRRYKALRELSASADMFLLSGTPFSNITEDEYGYKKADELYYILYFLLLYNKSLTQFRTDYCFKLPWDSFTYRMKNEVYDKLVSAIHKVSMTKKLEVDINMHEKVVYCDVDTKRLKTLKNDYYVETQEYENVTAANKAIMINKALQVANGFVYDETSGVNRFNTYKFDMLNMLLLGIKDNVVIFYNFKEDRNYLMKHLKGAVLYEGVETLDRWNRGEIKILLLSPFSEKYGLNLQDGGHTIIWYGLVWSAESYGQSNARLYRRGQKEDVNVYYLLARQSFDDYVYSKLVSKTQVIDDFMSYLKEDSYE
jgi:SNF2 family DNA or RNA helicase